ncbi:MFS transporter [Paraburkholderia tropica]|uniref:MFS transporter n=1 Tax=Paraburkholderia tropica TaxID=92647 RepID=UPI002AB7B172|nr:MFS transporter [Paraburkholderia tropica]
MYTQDDGFAMKQPPREGTFLHGVILAGTVICGTLAPTVIGPVLPAMQFHFASVPNIATLVPLIVTIPNLVLALFATGIGAVSDRMGRKMVLVLSLALYALAGTAPLFLNSIPLILLTRALVGVAEAAVMTISTSLIGDYFTGSRRDRFASVQVVFAATSATVFNLVGGTLGAYGWRVPFAAYALPLLLLPLVCIYIWEPVKHRVDAPMVHRPVDGSAFRSWLLVAICLVAFAVGLFFMVMPVWLSFMAVDRGIHSTGMIGVAYAINSFGVVVGTVCFGWILAKRVTIASQFALGAFLTGVGFLLMGNSATYSSLCIGGAIAGFGCGITLPALISWGLRSLPVSKRGFGTGAFTSAQFAGYFVSPLVVGMGAGALGTRSLAISFLGIVLLIVGALAFLGRVGVACRVTQRA